MANRMMTPVSMASFEKLTKVVFAKVTFGATGAVASVTNAKGIYSVTRNSTGNYTFVFGTAVNGAKNLDVYVKLLDVSRNQITATAPAAPSTYITNDSTAVVGTSSLTIQYNSAGTATDPGSGEISLFAFFFGDSTAP